MSYSTGGEQPMGVDARLARERRIGRQLGDCEGLVFSTARLYASMVGMDEEDLRQELRIRVWRAVVTYDASKTRASLKNYVFSAVTNKVKDYKRDAARRRQQWLCVTGACDFKTWHLDEAWDHERATGHVTEVKGIAVGHVEDMAHLHFIARNEIYGEIDEGVLVLPSALVEGEIQVLLLLLVDMSKPEIALRLAMTRPQVTAHITGLRRKFADWRPAQRTNASRPVRLAA